MPVSCVDIFGNGGYTSKCESMFGPRRPTLCVAVIANRGPFLEGNGTMKEEWRPIDGWEEWYEVSSLGRVRRIGKARTVRVGRILKQSKHPSGYKSCVLCRVKDGKRYTNTRTTHRIVAAAFLGPRPEGCDIHHKDGNKTNNRLGNLEYVSRQEHGLVNSRMTKASVLALYEMFARGKHHSSICSRFGISCSHAYRIKLGYVFRSIWESFHGKKWRERK